MTQSKIQRLKAKIHNAVFPCAAEWCKVKTEVDQANSRLVKTLATTPIMADRRNENNGRTARTI